MTRSLIFGIAFAACAAVPAFALDSSDGARPVRHRHVYHHLSVPARPAEIASNATAQVPAPAPASFISPAIAPPYANGQGDEDGLSRHINDCNKGCIGGNPG